MIINHEGNEIEEENDNDNDVENVNDTKQLNEI